MASPPERSAADHLAALKSYLPTGAVWPRDDDSALVRVCRGIAATVARLHGRADALVADAFPATTVELLPEWEASTGLPDPCAGPAPTLPQRQAQVVARLVARGGQSVPYFQRLAEALGFTVAISVEEFTPLVAGFPTGARAAGEAWVHVWRVSVPGVSAEDGQVLVCAFDRNRPSHTLILYAFGP